MSSNLSRIEKDENGKKAAESSPSVEKYSENKMLLWIITSTAALILFAASTFRHILFRSTAFDLAIFDQAIYLISQKETPYVSIVGFHILGDHAAWIFYPISLFYIIAPSVYWLFALQSLGLASGGVAIFMLARRRNISENAALSLSCAYLLAPLIFNANLFDFHSDAFVPSALLFAVYALETRRTLWFVFLLLFVAACKAALSLTIVGLGAWLIVAAVTEKNSDSATRRLKALLGGVAVVIGLVAFLIAMIWILPSYNPRVVSAISNFGYLGNSIGGIIINAITNPLVVASHLFTWRNVEYLLLLILPLSWGLSARALKPILAALPALFLNLLSLSNAYKDLIHHYSLPILPFLFLAILESYSRGYSLIRKPMVIVVLSIISFLALAKFGYFEGYLKNQDTSSSIREALTLVSAKDSVLTTSWIAPHLSHRKSIRIFPNSGADEIGNFDVILIDTRHPGWRMDRNSAKAWLDRLDANSSFVRLHDRDGVFLFRKKGD